VLRKKQGIETGLATEGERRGAKKKKNKDFFICFYAVSSTFKIRGKEVNV